MRKFIVVLLLVMVYSSVRAQDKDVSFIVIEKVPVYPGCEGDARELKNCFSKSIQILFAENFNTELPNQLNLKGGIYKVYMAFKISAKGSIEDIVAKAPHPKLEEECVRVMKGVPKLIPAELKGEKVAVKYAIPFSISVEETRMQRKERRKMERKLRKSKN